jgi:hypothetical protein
MGYKNGDRLSLVAVPATDIVKAPDLRATL